MFNFFLFVWSTKDTGKVCSFIHFPVVGRIKGRLHFVTKKKPVDIFFSARSSLNLNWSLGVDGAKMFSILQHLTNSAYFNYW